MGAFSVHFSMRFVDPTTNKVRTEQFPIGRKGQNGSTVSGIDPGAASVIRAGQLKSGDVRLTAKGAKALAAELTDGGRVSSYEKPVYYAAIRAARGQAVEITDDTGHWRKLKMSKSAGDSFMQSVKGTHFAP